MIAAAPAAAHDPNITFAAIALKDGRQVEGHFVVKGSDLAKDSGIKVVPPGESDLADPVRVRTAAKDLVAYLGRKVHIGNAAGARCRLAGGTAAAADDAVEMQARWDCAAVPGELIYTNELLLDAEINARQILRVVNDPARRVRILDAATLSASLTTFPPAAHH